jgi:hypothetical protein
MLELSAVSLTAAELAARIRSWDGTLAGALPLRRALKEFAPPRRPPADEVERAVFRLCQVYKGQRGPDQLLAIAAEDRNLALPFVGDPGIAEVWPYHHANRLSDDEAARWLEVLRGAAFGAPELAFVLTMFRARRRKLWVPASRALASAALRTPELALPSLQQLWETPYPGGLPPELPGGRLRHPKRKKKPEDPPDLSHLLRHTLHAAASYVSGGGTDPAFAGLRERLPRMPLPTGDVADASAVLLALAELAPSLNTPEDWDAFRERIEEAPPDDQVDEALRLIGDRTSEAPPVFREALELRLVRPCWRDESRPEGHRWRLLAGWLENARWLAKHGRTERLAQMTEAAPEAAPVLALHVEGRLPTGAGDALEALGPRLPVLLDEDIRFTTPPNQWVVTAMETIELLSRPEISRLPWRNLVARFLDDAAAADEPRGSVADVAWGRLAVRLTSADAADESEPIVAAASNASGVATKSQDSSAEMARWLLRDRIVPLEATLALAGVQRDGLAIQVAVQCERLLREVKPSHGGARAGAWTCEERNEQVRLLWRLLRADPPTKTFTELEQLLAFEDPALQAVVHQVCRLDAGRGGPPENLVSVMGALAAAFAALDREGCATGGCFAPFLRHTEALVHCQGPEHEGWLEFLRDWIFGGPAGDEGLLDWLNWLDQPLVVPTALWDRFAAAFRHAHALGTPTAEALAEVEDSAAALFDGMQGIPWPEGSILRAERERLHHWLDACHQRELAAREAAERVEEVLQAPDEESLRRLVSGELVALDTVPPDTLRKLHELLLDQFLLLHAERLRRAVSSRVQLRSAPMHLAPLLGGTAGGTLLVPDMSAEWVEYSAAEPRYWVVGALALLISWVLIASKVPASLPPRPGATRSRLLRALDTTRRTLPVFGIAAVLAVVTASLAVVTLSPEPSFDRVGMWSVLSLLFGITFNLLLQGQGITRSR